MRNWIRLSPRAALRPLPLLLAVALAAFGPGGCSRDSLPVGMPASGEAPDTRVAGEAPVALEAGFAVRLSWDGSASAGGLRGYQWKLCDVGWDGVQPADTAGLDPATGAPLHAWRFTLATDSTFVLSDPGRDLHTAWIFLVRAVDEDGRVDATPAHLGFTTSTLLPSIRVDRPTTVASQTTAVAVPSTVSFGWTGIDPDGPLGIPAKVRFLWKRALLDGRYVRNAFEFNAAVEELCSFADSNWSSWLPYAELAENRRLLLPDQPHLDQQGRQIAYLFAVQCMDTVGSVSLDRVYGANVANVTINPGLGPVLSIYEPSLGSLQVGATGQVTEREIAGGVQLQFYWIALASHYGMDIAGYRWGWDLTDPDDPDDPGWAVPVGDTADHRRTAPVAWVLGAHVLTVQAWDEAGQMIRWQLLLDVVPVPNPASQYPLLLVDDVPDRGSMSWPAESGTPLDEDAHRDAFWTTALGGPGGVAGFLPARDVFDTQVGQPDYRDLVIYRNVIWTSRASGQSMLRNRFQPTPLGDQPYNWLAAYQAQAGHLLLAGERVNENFVEDLNWMLPWVFAAQETQLFVGGQVFAIGFGSQQLPDGTWFWRGPERYPFASLGVSVMDHVKPAYNLFGLFGVGSTGSQARNPACTGVKALLLDADFASAHGTAGAVADTITTEAAIDWRDQEPLYAAALEPFPWGNDEFYDGDATARPTPWTPQICDYERCVEPMFRIYSRFDWIDDRRAAAGDPDWPAPAFNAYTLESACGEHALGSYDPALARTVTTGQVLGFVTHKLEDTKPVPGGDVVWGFDPYRFDHAAMTGAIRWVLGQHFGLSLQP